MISSVRPLVNRYLHAGFDATTGNLLELGDDASSPNLIESMCCWHSVAGRKTNESDWRVETVRFSNDAVESVLRSEHIQIERCFEIGRKDALLRARYRVRPLTGTKSLDLGVFPHIDFTSDFADAFEDERDMYDDGAELGDGRELPCWRVFFARGEERGLMLATRCKADMSHVQILARGLDFMPHVRINYSTNYNLQTAPVLFGVASAVPSRPASRERQHWLGTADATAPAAYELRFEIGPWSRKRHRAIFRFAKLDEPVDVGNPPPRGRTGPKPKGKVFYAHRFASPRQASRTFRRDRWLIAKVPWTQQGNALVAGTGVKPPPLTLDPKLKGDHRVFVGVGNSIGVKLRRSGDPETMYRLLPLSERKGKVRGPFQLALSGRHEASEIDCGTMDLTGKKLRLERFPDLHNIAMIDYVRFEPIRPRHDDPSRDRKGAENLMPGRNETIPLPHGRGSDRVHGEGDRSKFILAGMSDAPDLAPLVDAMRPTPEAWTAAIWSHARCGFQKVYWRIDGQCSDFPSKHNTMRYVSAKVHGMFYPQAKAYGRALRRFDQLRVVVEAGRKYGVEIWGWMRFNSYAGNVVSDFFVKHPEYHETWENGTKAMKLCLALPEVRRHKIDILAEAAGYGLQGLNLGFLRHAPVIHRHPILVDGYKQNYGNEPPLCMTDRNDQTYRFTLPPMDDESVRWYRYRAGFLTRFGRELRQRLRATGLGHVKISLWLRPNHHLYDGIDLDDWLKENLCDEVVISQRTYVDEPLPIAEPSPAWREGIRARVPLLRGIWAHDLKFAEANVARWIDEGYHGLSTYESNAAVIDPRFIEFYHQLSEPQTSKGKS